MCSVYCLFMYHQGITLIHTPFEKAVRFVRISCISTRYTSAAVDTFGVLLSEKNVPFPDKCSVLIS